MTPAAAGGIEVLAPAGGREALEAAVRAGADAVYLGGQAFGARAHAKNFSREELARAVEYCRQRGVRVHVTVNTLLKDRELAPALEFVEFLCGLAVDAVLVQDMGLLSLVRERAPSLPVHASTQMSLHTPAGVRLVQELGVVRAVLARELSLEEIREIAGSCTIELEAFVHGALCMSVSGQCLLSAALGGRSGNRGQCAQPCRLAFATKNGTGHDLSLRDLSFVAGIPQLREAGICSVKIEGRMKRPEYVAAAVSACRLAADGKPVPSELLEKLEAVFSRSGFTDGYLAGRRGRAMFGTRRKEDVTAATNKVLAGLRGLYRGERQSVELSLTLTEENGLVTLRGKDGEGHWAQAGAPAGEQRLSLERALQQLSKTGGTPFRVKAAAVPREGISLAVAELNALRRQVIEILLEERGKRQAIPFTAMPVPEPVPHVRQGGMFESHSLWSIAERPSSAQGAPYGKAAGPCPTALSTSSSMTPGGSRPLDDDQRIGGAGPAESPPALRTVSSPLDQARATPWQGEALPLRACFRSVEQIPPQAFSCRELVLPIEASPHDLEQVRDKGPALLLDLPRGIFGWEDRLGKRIKERMGQGYQDFVCGNLGAFQLCRELGARAHGSFGLNITNTAALEEFARLGLATAELSPELSGRETAALGGSLPRGTALYGRQALMLTRNCPLANSPKGCLRCRTPGSLTDRMGRSFPVLCRFRGLGGSELFNSVPLWLDAGQRELGAVDFGILRFTVENSVECGDILEAFQQGKGPQGLYTRGLFRRGVE